jgi:hypothetical protein
MTGSELKQFSPISSTAPTDEGWQPMTVTWCNYNSEARSFTNNPRCYRPSYSSVSQWPLVRKRHVDDRSEVP